MQKYIYFCFKYIDVLAVMTGCVLNAFFIIGMVVLFFMTGKIWVITMPLVMMYSLIRFLSSYIRYNKKLWEK